MQYNILLSRKCLIVTLFAFLGLIFHSNAQSQDEFMHIDIEEKGFSKGSVSCIMQDSRGFLWIGTSEGLARYDGREFRVYDGKSLGLSSSCIRAVEEDGLGNILIGTSEGLSVYDYSKASFTHISGFDHMVNAMVSDSRGRVWIAADAPVIFCYDPSTGKCSGVPMDSEGSIIRLAIDSSDRICFSLSTGGFSSFNTSRSSFDEFLLADPFLKINEEQIVGICFDSRSDDILYIAGKKFGLWEVNLRKGSVRQFYKMPKDVDATGLAEDGQYLWMPMTSGLLRFDISTRSAVVSKHDGITSIFRDSKDALWLGSSSDGLFYQSAYRSKFAVYTELSDGTSLKGSLVKSFSSDSHGRVIVMTENLGNLTFNPQTGKLGRFGTKVDGQSLSQSDSLFVLEDHPLLSSLLAGFTWESEYVLEDGRVLLGYDDGFVVFLPADFKIMQEPPYIYVTDLFVNGDVVCPGASDGILENNIDVTNTLMLPEGKESLGFQFSAPGYGPLSGYRVLCLLEGHDEEWQDVTDELMVCYEHVPAGSYLFHVAVMDPDGMLIEPHRSIVVVSGSPSPRFFSGRRLITIAAMFLLLSFVTWLLIYERRKARSVGQQYSSESPKALASVYHEGVPEQEVIVPKEEPEDFNKKLKRIVAANLSDPDFCVQQLEEQLGMSRSSLIRRMKANLDMRPVDYIRKCRLESAAKLLKEGSLSIKEVSMRAGFNSSSYFSKCFKEHFGILPGEYVKENVKK